MIRGFLCTTMLDKRWAKHRHSLVGLLACLPSMELTYPTWGSSENHRLKSAFFGEWICWVPRRVNSWHRVIQVSSLFLIPTFFPRDPGSPKLRMVLEPKYLAFRRWLYTPIIIWQGDWIPRVLGYPPRSWTARPWKVTFPIRKNSLPTTIFQGRAVKLWGCNALPFLDVPGS